MFNNALADASSGVTSPAFLDQLTLRGMEISAIAIPNSLSFGGPSGPPNSGQR